MKGIIAMTLSALVLTSTVQARDTYHGLIEGNDPEKLCVKNLKPLLRYYFIQNRKALASELKRCKDATTTNDEICRSAERAEIEAQLLDSGKKTYDPKYKGQRRSLTSFPEIADPNNMPSSIECDDGSVYLSHYFMLNRTALNNELIRCNKGADRLDTFCSTARTARRQASILDQQKNDPDYQYRGYSPKTVDEMKAARKALKTMMGDRYGNSD